MSILPSGIDTNDTPALEPPKGVTSNLVNPYNINQYVFVAVGLGLGISTLAVSFRIFAKIKIIRRLQLEDLILLISQFLFIAFNGIMVHAAKVGEGTHQWNVSIAHSQKIVELANIIEILYCPIILGAKIAVLLQIRRVLIVNTGVLHALYLAILWANIPLYFGLMFAGIFSCIPRQKLWNPSIPGHCVSTPPTLVASSVINIVSDTTLFILPLVVIAKLQLPKRTKLVITSVFGTGILGIITSIIRLVYTVILIRTSDFTWAIAPVGLWAIAEITSVILAGSIPLLPGVIKFVQSQTSGNEPTGLSDLQNQGKRSHLAGFDNEKQRPATANGTFDVERPHSVAQNQYEARISTSPSSSLGKDPILLGVMKTIEIETKWLEEDHGLSSSR